MASRAFGVTFVAAGILLVTACNVTPSATPDPLGPSGAAATGQIRDTEGRPIPGVRIAERKGSATAVSDDSGFFQLGSVTPGTRIGLTFTKEGYAPSVRYVDLADGDVGTVDLRLKPLGPPHPVDAIWGGSFSDGEVAVDVAGGARTADGQAVRGRIDVRIAHLDPGTDEILAAPGDTRGTAKDGNDGALASFGMIYVEAAQDGEEVRLGNVRITMDLPADTGADTPLAPGDAVPFWVFDEDRGTWVETGTGRVKPVKVDGGRLAFEVETPVTPRWWGNCDQLGRMTCVEGKVVDCAGNAIPRALVRAVGLSYRGVTETSSGQDGRYRLWPVRMAADIRIEARVVIGGQAYSGRVPSYRTPSVPAPCGRAPAIQVPVPNVVGRIAVNQGRRHLQGLRQDFRDASAEFYPEPQDAGACTPPPPEDTCRWVGTPKDPPPELPHPSDNVDYLDAGPYLLLAGPETVQLDRIEPRPSPYAERLPVGTAELRLYATGGGDFDLTATGSATGLDGFRVRRAVRLPAVPELRVLDGSLSTSRLSGLPVRWGVPLAPSSAELTMVTASREHAGILLCDVVDDGEFTIPPRDLGPMPSGPGIIEIARTRVRFFPTPDGMAAVGEGSSTAMRDVALP